MSPHTSRNWWRMWFSLNPADSGYTFWLITRCGLTGMSPLYLH